MESTSIREEEQRREVELVAARPRVQVGHGHSIATVGHPIYDEAPLDLSLGLHFSSETQVVEYDDGPDSDIIRAFRDMELSFHRTSPYGVHVWIQLSFATTLTERTLGLTPIPSVNANFDYTNKLEGAAACTGRFRADCCQPG
ncbi:hypothetical protein D6C91_04889 [Aureobasidium pullulans]|uniref:Uncharacterized protein n=1 Tax=Aureobasidium pullulans TaxID=5580 RepID=A0A4S9TDG5_AURPU|nr:hypothetical protein D6D29_10393 [Aureobasidium pullulans]THZ20063.1 hypothetical protein D6C91_04889 [Aureobasidium pullulans]THZ22672.1 hypothetical protein D6C89_05951 [Aureobasidium pullulans]TIA70516.1 hypothetical protein D6C76_07495 [Aureobasidium pullulans]